MQMIFRAEAVNQNFFDFNDSATSDQNYSSSVGGHNDSKHTEVKTCLQLYFGKTNSSYLV